MLFVCMNPVSSHIFSWTNAIPPTLIHLRGEAQYYFICIGQSKPKSMSIQWGKLGLREAFKATLSAVLCCKHHLRAQTVHTVYKRGYVPQYVARLKRLYVTEGYKYIKKMQFKQTFLYSGLVSTFDIDFLFTWGWWLKNPAWSQSRSRSC